MPQESEAAAPRPELPMRLTRLRVKNFRSIADIDIPLSPLTVLVGPNGSGKSNVVDALRFVRDVFARGLDQAVMDREGMGVIQRWGTEGIEIGLTFRIEEREQDDYINTEEGVEFITRIESAVQIEYDFTLSEIQKGTPRIQSQRLEIVVEESDYPKFVIVRNGSSIAGKLGYDEWVNDLQKRFFIPPSVEYQLGGTMLSELVELSKPLFDKETEFDDLFLDYRTPSRKQLIWLNKFKQVIKIVDDYISKPSFYSLNPSDLRRPQQLLKETPFDEKGRNMAAVLRRLKTIGEDDWASLRSALQRAVGGFKTIEIEPVGGYLATKFIYKITNSISRTSYLGQESDGTIRMLGFLVALYQDPAQPFLSIEEPEANIHPGALAVLASVLDEASLRSQILVTTHSPDMLDHLPAESFLVVEKVGDTTHVGPLDASQLASVRKRLFTPGELLRMEGLHRQTTPDSAA